MSSQNNEIHDRVAEPGRTWADRPGYPNVIDDPAGIRDIIDGCCKAAITAHVVEVSRPGRCTARFERLESGLVHLTPASGWARHDFQVLSQCCVLFTQGGASHDFLTRVIESTTGTGADSSDVLVLAIPQLITGVEARMAFRVPIIDDRVGARVVTRDRRRWQARPRNLSMNGMLLDFPRHMDPDLAVGDPVAVALTFGRARVRTGGRVRRRDRSRYGIFFPKSVTETGALLPSLDLRSFVKLIERHWIQQIVH